MLQSGGVFPNYLHSCVLYPIRKEQKFLRTYVKPISACTFPWCVHQSNASWKVELNASKCLPFLLTASYLHYLLNYSPSPNPKRGNLHFRKVCGHERRNLSLLQLGTVAPRPAVQMAWAVHPSGLLSLQNRWGNTSCQKKRVPKPLDFPACPLYRSRLLGRGGKWCLGSGGRKESLPAL